jgi:hypothetical protein
VEKRRGHWEALLRAKMLMVFSHFYSMVPEARRTEDAKRRGTRGKLDLLWKKTGGEMNGEGPYFYASLFYAIRRV